MEINMKNIKKVSLSALAGALAFTSVNAGEMSISGSMEGTFTKKGGMSTSSSPLGMDKELSITGSGELDNGVGVAYKQTTTDALAFSDSELVFTGVPFLGDASIALTSTGSPISAIDDVTPTAFEEANAAVGSVDDVNGSDGTYGIRYTLADAFGTGVKVDAMYFFEHGAGDANADNAAASTEGGNEDGYEITLQGSVPGVDGLSLGAGYALLNKSDKEMLRIAYNEAKAGFDEGGCPIGSVLARDGKVVSQGRNQRVQKGDPIAHGEMDALRKAGRQKTYRDTTLYTSLSPCMMCSGTIIQFGIPRVVIGEAVNFGGNEELLRARGVEVIVVNDQDCIDLMDKFIEEKPELWAEDIAE